MEVLENRDMAPAPVVIIGGFQQDLGMPQLWSSPTPMNSVGKTRGNASEPKVVPIIAPDQLQSSLLSSLEDNTGTPVASIPIHIPATPTPALEMNQIRPTEDSVSHFLSQKMPSSENVTISPITEKETTGHGNPPRENSNTTYVTPPSLSEAEPSTDLKPVSPFLDTVPSDDLATSPLPCHSSSQYLDLVNPDAWAICKSHPRIFVDDDGDNNEDLENELEAQNVPSPFLSIPQPRTTVTLVPSSPASPIADIGAKYSSPRTDLSLLINKP